MLPAAGMCRSPGASGFLMAADPFITAGLYMRDTITVAADPVPAA
jgi:hypothetical protein